jgi:hypothetical protein
MSTIWYILVLGSSPAGAFVHPHDEVGEYRSLEEAKRAAEATAGCALTWQWIEARSVYRAEVGHEQAAEISMASQLERIDAEVSPM